MDRVKDIARIILIDVNNRQEVIARERQRHLYSITFDETVLTNTDEPGCYEVLLL
ncbi:hypothetical protein Glove_221g87 [Diversispora epigaea]|uniref:Uncharacterized protein n=1 Tax=Diversispora epigaea TaxID=1348612 RepID=A0A397INL4_9GLOM|nr:hypothetical protein Glove_221g87 [Diversispora epigaea]